MDYPEPSLFTKPPKKVNDMIVINKIDTYPDKNIGSIKKDKKTFYVCCVCGRLSFKKIKAYNKVYCNKHYKQKKKYGKPIDDNPRTVLDRNEIRIVGDTAYMTIYNYKNEPIAETIFDSEDINKVRYTKWKLSNSGYIMNTPKFRNPNKHLSRVILNTDQFVDHINHNPLDNRKQNLRIVNKSQNAMNRISTKGVRLRPEKNDWYAYIKINQKMLNLGTYVDQEEALYARWYAERILFKEFAVKKQEPFITGARKQEIQAYVNKKVQRL